MTMTATSDGFANRARLAGFIFVGSFAIFVLACVSIPILGNAYVQRATQPLNTQVTASQGTVAIGQGNDTGMIALPPDGLPLPLMAGGEILTNAADNAALEIYEPTSGNLLVRGQVYGNTTIQVVEANAPRYAWSTADQVLRLAMSNGRVRLTLLPALNRPLHVSLETPHGTVVFEQAGQYAIAVSNEATQAAVQEGQLLLTNTPNPAGAESLTLQTNQRGLITAGNFPQGPMETQRNLIRNGNFVADLSGWIMRDWNIELAEQPTGETKVVNDAGAPTLHFARVGIGHADAAVRQILEQDVTDYETLRLLLSLRINEQTLGVCGTVGSECPFTIELDYVDRDGNRQVWRQGFYANGTIATDTPDTCINCRPPYNPHVNVPIQRLYTYDVELLDNLALQGFAPPRYLNSISLIAAGHGLDVDVVDISLLGDE